MACPSLTVLNAQRVEYRKAYSAPDHDDENWQFRSTIAHIWCPAGFIRFPLVSPKCQSSGIWDPPPPVCSGNKIQILVRYFVK